MTPQPASTVLLLQAGAHGPEVFMVRRTHSVAFMAGAHVFPGGRVDPADSEIAGDRWCDGASHAAAQLPSLSATEAISYHVAAVRELFEEAGVLLARDGSGHIVSFAGSEEQSRYRAHRADLHAGRSTLFEIVQERGLRLALDQLIVWAHWVTPPVEIRRFDTMFFAAEAPREQTPVHDDGETVESEWTTASEALARGATGDMLLPPPTWTSLRELERFPSVEAALAWARKRRIDRREPTLLEEQGRRMLLVPGDPLHPMTLSEPPPAETRFVLVDGRWRPVAVGT